VLTDGTTVRYSLSRSLNGDVYWRADTFAAIDDHIEPMRWLNHLGRLTVAEVITAAPQCEKTIRAWTQAEIDDGLIEVDWDQQDRRVTALDRLREQLETPGA
jgi:hypothetical protein